MEDIRFYNVTLLNVIHPFFFTLNYDRHINGTSNTPKWKNVYLDNIVTDNSTYTWVMQGNPESWLQNLVLGHINNTNVQTGYVASCYNVTGTCNNATVTPYCPSCIKKV
uniref:Uncharacterized protein n=1 Tax=Acrobeloides nanus TaxID=290746 RepID=A0A914E066_9BILA